MADVVMDYGLMNELTTEFNAAAQQLDENMSGLKLISGLVDDGALVGNGAKKFLDLLDNGIIPFTKQLQAKMEELAGDVEGARSFLQDGDETAASKFH
jgi:polyhydroxyalkanoate synthesis regulator phasin